MEYVFRFLLGFLVTWAGCFLASLIMVGRIRKRQVELNRLKFNLDRYRESLTKPASHIWVDVEDRLPTHNREYLVEYCFGDFPDRLFHSVHDFDIRENRFQHEGFRNLKVVRWAELPR